MEEYLYKLLEQFRILHDDNTDPFYALAFGLDDEIIQKWLITMAIDVESEDLNELRITYTFKHILTPSERDEDNCVKIKQGTTHQISTTVTTFDFLRNCHLIETYSSKHNMCLYKMYPGGLSYVFSLVAKQLSTPESKQLPFMVFANYGLSQFLPQKNKYLLWWHRNGNDADMEFDKSVTKWNDKHAINIQETVEREKSNKKIATLDDSNFDLTMVLKETLSGEEMNMLKPEFLFERKEGYNF
jgi:hypothetical protein